ERLLAQGDGQRAGFGDARCQLARLLLQFGGGNGDVDESPLDGGERVNHVAGHQHLQGALAANGAAESDHGRGAEQANLDAGRGKACLVRSDGEVTGGHQLAAGGGGDALHLCDDRLRYGLDAGHKLGADVEDFAVVVEVTADHLAEVMAGGENFSRGGENH